MWRLRSALAYWPWIRRLRDVDGRIKPWWYWTPITYGFGHSGWVYLSFWWFLKFWNFNKKSWK